MVSLRRSSRVATADEEHDTKRPASAPRVRQQASPKWPQHAVQLRADDAEKLTTVLASVAPQLLDAQVDKHRTLRDALEKGSSLQQLYAYASMLGTAKHGGAVRREATTDASLLLFQHFLCELAQELSLIHI